MITTIANEIYWLILTATLTGLLSVVYVLNIIVKQWPGKGLNVLYSPPEPGEDRFAWQWGNRAYSAHMNAVENLVVFASLAIAVHVTDSGNAATAMACEIYFWARLIHAVFYIFGVPYVRTISWTVGLIGTLTLAYQLLFLTIINSTK